MMSFATDPWICLPLGIATILGGLGFPVLFEIGRRLRGRSSRWSLHVRVTVITYAILFIIGVAAFLLGEWNNPRTIGPIDTGGKIVIGVFHGIQPRTAGFNSIDMGQADPSTLLITDVLMFIGGGSAGTAGGIKITTFLVLGFAIWNEVRGRDQVTIAHRSISSSSQRQALSVALLGIAAVIMGTMLLLMFTDYSLEKVLFESISAFATVGMSTGITYNLPPAAEWVLMALMFTGRIGTVAVASALALSARPRLYRLPEERPIIG
jgi:trk system potassium uptake protein